jgi:hypothetical protein
MNIIDTHTSRVHTPNKTLTALKCAHVPYTNADMKKCVEQSSTYVQMHSISCPIPAATHADKQTSSDTQGMHTHTVAAPTIFIDCV